MPRVKSAAAFARERLQTGKDVTPKERVTRLKIISADDRQKKQLQRAKLDAGTTNRYTKKPQDSQNSATEIRLRTKRSVSSGLMS